MKTLFTFALIGLMICGVASVGAGASTSYCHTYTLPDIKHLELNAFAAIDIRQGKVNEIKVTAEDSFMEHLELQVKDSTLVIRDKRPQSYWLQQTQFYKHLKNKKNAPSNIHFLITLKNPENIMLTGYLATNIKRIKSDALSLTFTGSGSLNLAKVKQHTLNILANGHIKTSMKHVHADQGSISINGNGKVDVAHVDFEQLAFLLNGLHHCTLEGKAHNLHINMQGAGTCSGQDFIVNNAHVGLQGSSELILDVDTYLQATTMDDSRVRYYGRPKVINNGADVTRLAASTPTHMFF
ncbi:hypothetical protein TDB9533_01752 [Thalassocella blandensis]|nr:hypothetical protein TDB9533_01752 [Thalassocella blandensis]